MFLRTSGRRCLSDLPLYVQRSFGFKSFPWWFMVKISAFLLRASLWMPVMTMFGHGLPASGEDYKWVAQWGGKGMENGQFDSPVGVAVDGLGNVFVSDSGNNRVQKFSSNGKFLLKWGSKGEGDGQFLRPAGLAVDKAGVVYVVDAGNFRVQKFD